MLILHNNETVYNMRQKTGVSTDEVIDKEQSALALHVGTCQNPGLRRKSQPNEDTLSITQGVIPASSSLPSQPFVLLLVADGMGGHANGKQASLLATSALTRYVSEGLCQQPKTSEALLLLLKAGIQYANQTVFEYNLQKKTSMGTTLTAAMVIDGTVYIAHVGDSRFYLYRELGGLTQITQDHSVVADFVAAGIIGRDDIYTHPMRNQIYRSLGGNSFVEVDVYTVSLVVGDILLLCTDGLWEMVHDTQIARILTIPVHDPEDTAYALIRAALAQGGDDNVSTIVAHVN